MQWMAIYNEASETDCYGSDAPPGVRTNKQIYQLAAAFLNMEEKTVLTGVKEQLNADRGCFQQSAKSLHLIKEYSNANHR
jgi:hypothetical protein